MSLQGRRVLVIDDEADLRQLVRRILERAGARVVEAPDGRAGLRALYAERPHAVVLDLMMPGLDGWATLERIRDASDVPVLMLTARGAELDRVRALRGGADDYVPKPFGAVELLARVEALLRRGGPAHAETPRLYEDGYLSIDHMSREVFRSGRPVELTPLEFRLLTALVRHPRQALEHQQLLELVWGTSDGVSPAQVKLYVGYLRRKLREVDGADPPIETLRGVGYRYRPPEPAS